MKKASILFFGLALMISSCTTAQNQHQKKIDKATALAAKFLKDQQIPGM